MAAPSYSHIRRTHLVLALRSLSRRQQTAIMLLAAILGPTTVGMLDGMASGVGAFVSPATPPAWRLGAWLAWLIVTGLVVLALREPVFMLAARPFLRMLPIRRRSHFACDVRSIAIAYSFLWLPVGYFLWRTWSSGAGTMDRVDATLVLVSGLAVAASAQALALQPRRSAAALVGFSALACCMAPSVSWPGSWLVLVGALALCGLALTIGYERPPAVRATFVMVPRVASHVAAWSGLAVPVAWRDLRHAIGLRFALLLALLAAGAWLAGDADFCKRHTGLFIVQGAFIALALYRVPALIDERLREALPWIFRLAGARARSIVAAAFLTGASFALTSLAASATWSARCGTPDANAVPVAFAGALAALGAIAFRWREASTWIAIVAVMALAFILGEAL